MVGHRSAKQSREGYPVKARVVTGLGIRLPIEKVLVFAAILLIALFLIDLVFIWQGNIPGEVVNPASVVYGEPMHILHRLPADLPMTRERVTTLSGSDTPRLQIDKTLYDVGRIGPLEPVSRMVLIRNNGTGVLRIIQGYTTCGCTTADLTASEIPPGKAALLTVTFNPAFHNLQDVTVRRGVILETNDPQHPLVELWIQAAVQ